ncbi:MAG: polyprenol monophosphomannose synthase [Candidatus Omnitrophica bacterium]|jgi:dolichol-phosphate mannosyltransferase|nr:polyprenol monophosphomannose synthase [Candidatus Omnitrophota bacterium]
MQNIKIAVVIPTYNEVNNIAIIIEKIFSLGDNFFILVVDDNSPDGTSKVVKDLQGKYPALDLITRKERLGLGNAYKDGFRYILEKNYNVIVQIDADLSHPYSCIMPMISLLDKYDLVIGSRYVKGGNIYNWPLSRIILSRLGNIFAKLMLGLPARDLTSGFKCIKGSVLEKIDCEAMSSQGYFFQIELILRSFLKGLKIVEYPITFQGRSKGKSKLSLYIFFESFLKVTIFGVKRIFKKCCYQ